MTNVHNFLNSITRTMNTNELHSYFQIKKKVYRQVEANLPTSLILSFCPSAQWSYNPNAVDGE